MGEEWRPIKGFEEKYSVSSNGVVRSSNGNLIALVQDKDGYLQVTLWRDNKATGRKVHRLVLESFVGSSALDANHKDGNKKNNALSNLEWCSHRENSEHAARNNLMAFGSRHGLAKLTEEQIPEIRRAIANGSTYRAVASEHGVSVSTISDIVKGVTWRRA